ncbi:hypothetical protein U1Q18_012846 [Sarracenia purpurea var. burkii]
MVQSEAADKLALFIALVAAKFLVRVFADAFVPKVEFSLALLQSEYDSSSHGTSASLSMIHSLGQDILQHMELPVNNVYGDAMLVLVLLLLFVILPLLVPLCPMRRSAFHFALVGVFGAPATYVTCYEWLFWLLSLGCWAIWFCFCRRNSFVRIARTKFGIAPAGAEFTLIGFGIALAGDFWNLFC